MISGHRAYALFFIALAACSSREPTLDTAQQHASPALAAIDSTSDIKSRWCGEGWRAIDETTCVALPERFASPPSLVIHAHGALAPDARPTEEQAALLAASKAHGFAVLFTRGRSGLCKWSPEVSGHYCWPTTQQDVDKLAPEIYATWRDAQGRVEDMAGTRFERRYLFGFSNGGYFTAFTSVEGRFPVDGAGVVGAGRSEVDESLMTQSSRPIYIAVGDQEDEKTQKDGYTLSQALTGRGWPVHYVVHVGRAHQLREDDLAAAWSAWGRGEEKKEP